MSAADFASPALAALVAVPLLGALLCWARPLRRAAWGIAVAAGVVQAVLALLVAAGVLAHGRVFAVGGWFEADGLSALVLGAVSFVTLLAGIYAGGYMRRTCHQPERLWWFYCNFNLFAFALLAAPAMADPNLSWVGVELVTLFGILLVGFEGTTGALEAAWKFAVLTVVGAPIALFGFFVLFWAFHGVPGAGAHETWDSLRAAAPLMQPRLLTLAFVMVLVGFGAKTGLVPMHTWLPDAHSQAPTPVCAMLSAVKTTVPLYVILRMLAIVFGSPAAHLGAWMVGLGLFSVGVAAFLLLQVRDYKRLFAYSTVEHMGIILVAAGFATPAAEFGAAWQLLNHAITKSLCFYVAGAILLGLGTREIKAVRGLWRSAPFTGVALLLCTLAIAGAPPFPIFLSELKILEAGIHAGQHAAVALLATFIVIAFAAILGHANTMLFGKPETPAAALTIPRALPLTCKWVVVAALVPVLVLGLYIPGPLRDLLQLAAQQLGGH